MTDTVSKPAANLINNIAGTFYSPQSIPHEMPEAMNGVFLSNFTFQLFIQSGTRRVSIGFHTIIISGKGELIVIRKCQYLLYCPLSRTN